MPGRSSCKLVSWSWLKYNILSAPCLAVRNQFADCKPKDGNFKDSIRWRHSRCGKMNPHRDKESKLKCNWKKMLEVISVVVKTQLYKIICVSEQVSSTRSGSPITWDWHLTMWDYINETCYNLVQALIQRCESTVCHVTYNETLMILEEKFIRTVGASRNILLRGKKIEQPEHSEDERQCASLSC